MFGYVMPCKMELKIKDYEKFKAYYCGLCKSIKTQYGNFPRAFLNYDMTFLAIVLDSLNEEKICFKTERCFVHPIKKRVIIYNSKSLDFAASTNILLAYYKLLDDAHDDKSLKSSILSTFLNKYNQKNNLAFLNDIIKEQINELNEKEKNCEGIISIDEVSHPFAHLTGSILKSYIVNDTFKPMDYENLYWLGYNLGKWIYIIDAYDDLKEDMEKNKFNPLNSIYNKEKKIYTEFSIGIKERIEFLLTSVAASCYENLKKLPLRKNEELVENILALGLMEKTQKVMLNNKKSKENF